MDAYSHVQYITSFYLENLPGQILDLFVPQTALSLTPDALPSFAAQLGVPGAFRERTLRGISQYFCLDQREFPEISDNAQTIAATIRSFIDEKVIPAAEHGTCACDVYYSDAAPLLLDYNPLSGKTGLCLFDAGLPQPDGAEMRFRHKGNVVALPLQ